MNKSNNEGQKKDVQSIIQKNLNMTRSIWSPKGNETTKINIEQSPNVSIGGFDNDYLSSKFFDLSKEKSYQDYHDSANV